ncbi:MAG: tripartite tricarboxylate transporter TctB family protein [Hyphomicrobiaceae bacterium]
MSLDKDVWAGLFFMGLASLGLVLGANYGFGTTAQMGPGFLPRVLCLLMLGLGAIIAVTGLLRSPAEAMGTWGWGQLLAVLTSVLLFGATLEGTGMERAVLGAVLVSGIAHPQPRRFEQACLAIAALMFALHLTPGVVSGLGAAHLTGLADAPLLVGWAASILAVLGHARHAGFAAYRERIVLAALLAIFAIVVFIDGLGLTLRSQFVLDAWGWLKQAAILPLVRALGALIGS